MDKTMTDDHTDIQRQLVALNVKLDRLDEAIRGTPGNGSHPGIQTRLDRLEQDAKRISRLVWLCLGALVAVGASNLSDVLHWISAGVGQL